MQIWDDILAAAVVGTDQREFRLAPREDELGSLLAQISNTDREGLLLSAASVVALYRSAGVAPPADAQPLPEACSDDEVSRSSLASGQHLGLMLDGEFREVLPEWLSAMNRAGKRVPEEYLPTLLDHGRAEPSLRRMILAVLGRRGEWLAAQNPDWNYAIQREEKDVWETGSREERLLLLDHLRGVDPLRARELLATTWSQESAKDRVDFLEKLATGVNSGDESFLNEALQDRSVEVRRVARALLARLPQSDFSRRLKSLATQVLSFKKALMGRARIEVALPEDPIPWLQANGIEMDSPPRNTAQTVGPKAWTLTQMISLIPITHWTEVWRKSPAEVIRAADYSEWGASLIAGLIAAVQRDRDPDFIEALVSFASAHPNLPPRVELATHLPPARLEALILHAFKTDSDALNDGHSALPLLMTHRSAWSDQLSRTVVHSIKKRINVGKDTLGDWQTKSAVKQFARYVSPALYDELAADWPMESETWLAWSKGVNAFQSLLAFRRDMHRAISEKE